MCEVFDSKKWIENTSMNWGDGIAIYPCIIEIKDEKQGIDRKFYLDDLEDINSGAIKLTDHERELVFLALLNFYIDNGKKIYENFVDEAYKKGIPKEQIKTRASINERGRFIGSKINAIA